MDFQLSLISLINGYKEGRRIDIIPAFGLGYMRVFDYKGIPNINTISTNFELMGKYRLNDKLDINLKVQASVLPDHFDGRIAGNKYEYYSSASLGLTYYFKKRGFEKFTCPPNIPIIKSVKEVDTLYQVVYKIDTVYKEIHKVDTIQIISVRNIQSNPERQIERSSETVSTNKVKTEKISAVFLDLEMPGMNGVEAAVYMRTWQIQSKSKFPVYAFSSHDKSWLGDKNFAQYFNEFIPRHEFKKWIVKHKNQFL